MKLFQFNIVVKIKSAEVTSCFDSSQATVTCTAPNDNFCKVSIKL
jgi:hypothetical protein